MILEMEDVALLRLLNMPDEAAAWLQRMEAAGVAPNAVCFNNVIQGSWACWLAA